MFCSNCGQKIDSDSHFCIYCGHKVKVRKPQSSTEESKGEVRQPSKQNGTENKANEEERSDDATSVPEDNPSMQVPEEKPMQNSDGNREYSAAPISASENHQQRETLEERPMQDNANDEGQSVIHNGIEETGNQDSIHTTSFYEDMMIYAGKNSPFYDKKWRKMEQTSRNSSWNFASFFLTLFWLGYRRLYKELFIVLGLFFVVEFIVLFSKLDIIYLQSANFGLGAATAVVMGLFGNNFYRRQVEKKVTLFRNEAGSQDEKEMLLRGKGGPSTGGLFVAIGIYAVYFLILLYMVLSMYLPVLQVKGGHLDAYPDITVGEAFNDFFDKKNWEAKGSKASFKEIEFTGTKKFEGKKHDIKIDIIISSDDAFQFDRIIVDGDELNNNETNSFIEFIFDDSEGLEYW